ncbi:uncharacterized protein QYS62_006499 [Fusarium acuminatum]|uniref:Transcription factor domain-containing protein n=1 Tax=Fusarium acuminatum TaxID=5515 RepID=A0ABZ2WYC0_9HYPO
MDFVIVSKPGQRASAKTTRRAHSHAARVAHARARRQRMAEYVKDEAQSHDYRADSVPQNDGPESRNLEATLTGYSIPDNPAGNFECDQITHFRHLLSPREHFIFNHYTQVVLPYLVSDCPLAWGLKDKVMDVGSYWMFFNASDPIILRGFLLVSCRHLSLVGLQDEYTQLAMRYKLYYLQTLRGYILSDDISVRRKAVAITTVLALDEMACGNHRMAAKHILGAMKMIEASGGIANLELNEVVRYSLWSLVYSKRLIDWDTDLYLQTSVLTPDAILS